MSVDQNFIDLASDLFGNPALGREIGFKVDMAVRMKRGADAQKRPSVRRDKLGAIAKTIRKLQNDLSKLDPMTIADMMGRVGPAQRGNVSSLENHGAQEYHTSLVPTPVVLEELCAFSLTLEKLAAGSAALAGRQNGIRRGADETPDALMFALEGLESIWQQGKAVAPEFLTFKAGGFGDFALRALSHVREIFTEAEIRTALRRLHEQRQALPESQTR